jgi:predicted HTH domain antitoxin
MKTVMRTVVLDDELATLLEQEKPLDQAAREALVMDLFRRGRISTGKACELLSLDRLAFAQRAAELGIPYFQMTKEDWEDEKVTIDAWPRSS